MINIVVIGSKGQLGLELASLKKDYSNFNFFFVDKSRLDITDFKAVEKFILIKKIQVLINCAAYTNVDKAEQEPNLANEINYLAVKNLGEVAKKQSIKLIHISTDYVFDGKLKTPYLENMETNPQNVYGTSKLNGENALLKINPKNAIIIRTSWLYSSFGKNFVKTILKLSAEKEEISVVFDQIGSPTYANDLAKIILQIVPLINNEDVQLYHYANIGECSWFQFAKEIVHISNYTCKVEPIAAIKFNAIAKRPNFSLLNTEKFRKKFNVEIPKWEDSLKNCILKIQNDIKN